MGYNKTYDTGSAINASYNWEDVASGLGYNIFYAVLGNSSTRNLIDTNVSTADTPYLVTFSQSNVKVSSSAFNSTRTIKGDVFFDFYGYAYAAGACSLTIRLQKYDGSTYTDITSDVTLTWTAGGAANIHLLGIATATETLIKKGEKIVLNISTNNGNTAVKGNSSTTPNLSHIPFKVVL